MSETTLARAATLGLGRFCAVVGPLARGGFSDSLYLGVDLARKFF